MSKSKRVRIYRRNDRGFHGYGKPMQCDYRTQIEVYESSLSGGPHVWLNMTDHPSMSMSARGEAHAHLSAKQAQALINRLQTWLDEIPSRWGGKWGK